MRFLFENYRLDADRHELTCGSELIAIGPKVFDLLLYLVQNRNQVALINECRILALYGPSLRSTSAFERDAFIATATGFATILPNRERPSTTARRSATARCRSPARRQSPAGKSSRPASDIRAGSPLPGSAASPA